jgi:hypothetical protein
MGKPEIHLSGFLALIFRGGDHAPLSMSALLNSAFGHTLDHSSSLRRVFPTRRSAHSQTGLEHHFCN